MKYLILFLLFLPMLATAQRSVASEASSLRWGYNPLEGDSMWYAVKTTTFNDNSVKTDEQPLKDTIQVVDYVAKEITATLRLITFYINKYWEAEQSARQHAKQAETLLGQFDSGISQWSIEKYREQFDSTQWEVTVNGGQPQAATIVASPNGKRLLLRIAGGNPIQIFLVADTRMLVLNYPQQGQEADLIRVLGSKGFEFRNLAQSIKLEKL